MSQEFLKELISPGEKSNSFEESLLWKYSELARLSYKDGDIPGYADLVVDEHDRIIGKKNGQEVWVGFRGSGADSAHWLGNTGNLHALPNHDSVCRGFANAMQKFHDSLKSWCQGCRNIHLTGHSRGGAFATLEGWLLANDFEDAEVNVVVFGCPRVGTSTFAEKFRNRRNLRWAGFQHAGDHVGNLPPWGEHVHPPANPLTDFQAGSSPLLQRIPKVGNALNIMRFFGSNLMKNHSMESYHQSLKCNFILRTGAPDVDELINIITDEKQKAMLTIGVRAVKASEKQIQEEVRQAADELRELLSADRLKEIISEALIKQSVIQLAGTVTFLANMYSRDSGGMQTKVYDLEEKLHILVEQLAHVPHDSTDMLKLLLEAFFKGGFILTMCRMELGDKPHDLKERFAPLVKDINKYLWKLAHDLPDADAFFAALPSLVKVEAACAAQLNNREPLFVTDEIQDELLPHHLQPTKVQQEIKKLKKEFGSQVASEGPGGVAKLLSSEGLGPKFVGLLQAILKDVARDSEDEHLQLCHEEVEILKTRMAVLRLPEVVLTGPTKVGKSSLTNALLGKEVASTRAVPDSFLPIRFIPEEGGKTFHVEPRGVGLKDRPDLFKDKLDKELTEMLEAREVNTPEEVHDVIKTMNRSLRTFLDSEIFGQKFSDEEKTVLCQHLCGDWSVDIKIPVCSHEALPVILVDSPGSTEGGLIGEFIKTMVRGSCIRASTALLLLTPDMITELDLKGPDLMERYFGGVSNISGYYIVITKVFEQKKLDETRPTACKKAGQLEPEPLGIRFINSYLLSAHAASCIGPLPEKFPSVEADASDEERQMCQAEQQRFQNVFWGTQNRCMEEMDQEIFTGSLLKKYLDKKLEEFKETVLFTPELYTSVDQRFPELFLVPHLKTMQRHIAQLVDEIHQHMETCSGSERQRQEDIDACRKLLSQLDVDIMEPVKEKAMLLIQGKIQKMAEFDLAGRSNETTEKFYNDVSETFSPGVADWCRRNESGKRHWTCRDCNDFFYEIRCLAMRESTKAYGKILRQELAEKLGWIRENDILSYLYKSLSRSPAGKCQLLDLPTASAVAKMGTITACMAPASLTSVAAAIAVSSAVGAWPLAWAAIIACGVPLALQTGQLFNAVVAGTPDERLANLKKCADMTLSRLNSSFKNWLEKKLERRLSMLEEKESDLPQLEEKLQQYLTIFGNLQEIAKVVKDS